MRYKIWNHDDHYFVQTQNMEKALDKSLSLKERYWDTVHHVEEDCNMGKQTIFINFRNPADIGFDPEITGTGSSQGVDKGSYPTAKKVVFGVNITF